MKRLLGVSWGGRRLFPTGLSFALVVVLAACNGEAPPEEAVEQVPPPPETVVPPEPPSLLLTPVGFDALPGWSSDPVSEALPALLKSCGRLARQPGERAVGPDGLAGQVADWAAPCAALEQAQGQAGGQDDAALRRLLENSFQPFAVSNAGQSEGLFTGYYEAELKGTRDPAAPGATPLYRLPKDLVTVDLGRFRADLRGERLVGQVRDGRLLPYLTRKEIDAGALDGQNAELLWADDPVDVFFLHVQGSGRVIYPDGSSTRVGFAGSNGHSFYAIGRALIDEGIVSRKDSSMQSIRDWLRANPARAQEIMQRNARYIFFREIVGEGPIGAQGVALTPGRSLAVDSKLLPLGVPLYLDTTWPATDKPLRRLMVAQDVGSAIKGAVRGDFFWGSGEAALAEAGRMKQKGVYYLLLPKAVAERRQRAS
ncbi:murein transglycosylase [Pelagibius litoralis]|uniref:peptidoglycan lytic exotransglycosylase n=1 Tax=Pelagibius litoralis TaxID=374515 RepID=A0A967F2A6_9PROT|nr:murein transglycosylase [Pelagibius litoralis]